MKINLLVKFGVLLTSIALSSCASSSMSNANAIASPDHSANEQLTLWRGNTATIWDKLQHTPKSKLASMEQSTSDANKKAWLQLALISKQYSRNTKELVGQLIAWREHNPSHPANSLFPDDATLSNLLSTSPPKHIAVLLPLKGNYGTSGKAVREGFLNAYYANSNKIDKQSISFQNTGDEANMSALYQQATAKGADFIIGPLEKNNVQQLTRAGSLNATTLALNYTDVGFGGLPTNLYQFGLLPEDEAQQIADRASETGLSRAIVIAPQDAWGKRLSASFTSRWKANGGKIQDTWYYSSSSNFSEEVATLLGIDTKNDKKLMQEANNKSTLEKQRRQDFDVIFVFAQPQNASLIIPMLKYYYANNVPIYTTSNSYTGNPTKDADLNGVTVCDIPWNSQHRSTDNGTASNRLYAVGQDAYLLSANIERLNKLPNFPIYGMTGALTLSAQNQIHRRLPCNEIRNGHLS